jgi:general nucleoside transport system permease protein
MTKDTNNDEQANSLLSWLGQLWRGVSVPLTAVFLAGVIGALLLWLSGASPWEAYTALYQGAFGDANAVGRTLEKATPLILGGLAVAFAFKAGLFNIGGQGQLLMGAIIAGAIGFSLTGLPAIIHMPLALLIGSLMGALFAAIAGALRTYTGAHEVITTIMLNFIAINITDYFANGPWKAEGIIARTPAIQEAAAIPVWRSLPTGFFIAVVVSIITWYLLFRTTLGYEIRTVGLNPNAAHYAGIKVARTIILTMAISGFLAGMGGAIETLGVVGRYQPGFNSGLGFDGITIALLARTHPLGVIPAALLVGAMQAGSSQMQYDANVQSQIIDVIQALILFFVSADLIVRWILRMRADEGGGITISSGWGSS